MYACTYACTYICTTYICTYICIRTYRCMYVVRTCVCVCVCVCVRVCACVCVWHMHFRTMQQYWYIHTIRAHFEILAWQKKRWFLYTNKGWGGGVESTHAIPFLLLPLSYGGRVSVIGTFCKLGEGCKHTYEITVWHLSLWDVNGVQLHFNSTLHFSSFTN